MKLSTKGRYGVLLMIDLAMHMGTVPVSLKSVAERQQLSEHYLEQLIAPLRNAGLVRSVRGAHGGYILVKPADEITVGDVIRVLEGPITVVDEDDQIILAELWERVRDSINRVLDSVTVAELASKMSENNDAGLMFYI